MTITVVTPPALLPVTLEEAKAYCRVDFADEDILIAGLIAGARDHVEQATGRVMVATTFSLVIDTFPVGEIRLPRSPLISVTSVEYYDAAGALQTLAPSQYTVDFAEPSWIVPLPTGWPATLDAVNSVEVTFSAGYAAPGQRPATREAGGPEPRSPLV